MITFLVSDKITVDILNLSPACENLRGFVAAGLLGLCRKLSTAVDKHVHNFFLYERITIRMDKTELKALWEQILAKATDYFSPTICKQWLSPLTILSIDDTTMVIGARTDFTREWVNDRYRLMLEDVVKDVLGSARQVKIETIPKEEWLREAQEELPKVQETLRPKDTPEQQTLGYADPVRVKLPNTSSPAPAEMLAPSPDMRGSNGSDADMHLIAPGDYSSLNPKYTFDTFVTGGSNRFAHAAALAVAENPGKVYNPFFMYGGVGLGKTHLMHAIGNSVLKSHPEMRVLYVSSEQFTNEIIQSIQKGQAESFRQKYRNIDVLLVDDIQFISGKTSTQEEFFHTFNTLHDAQKQIILSSDRPPKEVQKLEDRLRSRFEWGLITDIQAPDLETRIAILKNKAIIDHFDVPNDVMVYIASRIDSNIRELEGALTRVVAYASLNKIPITTEVVASALKDVFPQGASKEITMEIIESIVANYFKVSVEDLHSKKRSRNIAFPRQIAMYLCRELTETSLPQIGNFFGGRDHTTVLHACDKISKDKETEVKLANTITELIEEIQK